MVLLLVVLITPPAVQAYQDLMSVIRFAASVIVLQIIHITLLIPFFFVVFLYTFGFIAVFGDLVYSVDQRFRDLWY